MVLKFTLFTAWYTDNTPRNDAQVAAHFSSKRPLLGICLKRYTFTTDGKAIRLDTYIDIPTEIALPHFIQDDNMDENGPTFGNFKLSLQAIVCHRGNSVDSGHYIAIVRGTSPNVASPTSSDGFNQPSPETPRHWMRFDDLAMQRVTLVDIDQALKTESPYLLFYQILPIDQDPGVANLPDKPPSSRASDMTLEMEVAEISRKLTESPLREPGSGTADQLASDRPSVEVTAPDGNNTQTQGHGGRRSSVVFSEIAPASTQSCSSPSSPRLAPMGGEGTKGAFGFRRGSRHSKSTSGSRAGSQPGENRLSATLSKFADRLGKDRPGDDDSAIDADDTAPDDVKLGPSAQEKETGAKGKTKDRPHKGKGKDGKDKHRNLERECTVM